MLFCIVTFNLWLYYNKLLTYLLTIADSFINYNREMLQSLVMHFHIVVS